MKYHGGGMRLRSNFSSKNLACRFFTIVLALVLAILPWTPQKYNSVLAVSRYPEELRKPLNAGVTPFQPAGWYERPGIPGSNLSFAQGNTLIWGMLLSTTEGRMWRAMSREGCSSSATYAAVSPTFNEDFTLLVAGEGGYDRLCVSHDAGQTWITPEMGLEGTFTSVIISPDYKYDGTFFVASKNYDQTPNLWQSTDRGESWSRLTPPPVTGPIEQLVISPQYSKDHALFAVILDGSLWKTSDTGTHWTNIGGARLAGRQVRKALAVPNSSAGIALFALTEAGMAVSYDQGNSWNWLNNSIFVDFALPNNALTSRIIFACAGEASYGYKIYRSTDLGKSWKLFRSSVVAGLPVFSPNYASDRTFYLGDYDAFYKSTDNGVTLVKIASWPFGPNYGEEFIQLYASRTLNPGVVIAVNQGREWTYYWNLFYSLDGGYHWKKSSMPETPENNIHLAISPEYETDHLVFVSIDNSLYTWDPTLGSWKKQNGNLPTGHAEVIRISPNYAADKTVWISSYGKGVYRSTNTGLSWTQLTGFEPWVNDLELSPGYPTDPTAFISVYNSGIFRSSDNGQTWTAVQTPYNSSLNIELSPSFSQDHTLFAANNSSTGGGVWRSENRGESWVNLSAGLCCGMVYSLSISPRYSQDQTLVVSTIQATYISEDAGSTWFQYTWDIFKNLIVLAEEGNLPVPFVATYSGIYRYQWSKITPPPHSIVLFDLNQYLPGSPGKTLFLPGSDPFVSQRWSIETNAGWLSASPDAGSLPGNVTLQVDHALVGDYAETDGSITIYRSYRQKQTFPIKVIAGYYISNWLPLINR